MKKFQFRLQKLLWYHQQRQKQADVQLQQAAWQREQIAAEIHAIQRQIMQACHLSEAVGKVVNVAARENMTQHLESLGRTLTAAEEKLKLADQRLREAQRVRAEITQEVEALVHLRSQQHLEYRDEIARQQQIVLDEVVMRQWSMRDADATA